MGRQESVRSHRTLHGCFAGNLPTRVDAICALKKRSIGLNEGIEFCHRAVRRRRIIDRDLVALALS